MTPGSQPRPKDYPIWLDIRGRPETAYEPVYKTEDPRPGLDWSFGRWISAVVVETPIPLAAAQPAGCAWVFAVPTEGHAFRGWLQGRFPVPGSSPSAATAFEYKGYSHWLPGMGPKPSEDPEQHAVPSPSDPRWITVTKDRTTQPAPGDFPLWISSPLTNTPSFFLRDPAPSRCCPEGCRWISPHRGSAPAASVESCRCPYTGPDGAYDFDLARKDAFDPRSWEKQSECPKSRPPGHARRVLAPSLIRRGDWIRWPATPDCQWAAGLIGTAPEDREEVWREPNFSGFCSLKHSAAEVEKENSYDYSSAEEAACRTDAWEVKTLWPSCVPREYTLRVEPWQRIRRGDLIVFKGLGDPPYLYQWARGMVGEVRSSVQSSGIEVWRNPDFRLPDQEVLATVPEQIDNPPCFAAPSASYSPIVSKLQSKIDRQSTALARLENKVKEQASLLKELREAQSAIDGLNTQAETNRQLREKLQRELDEARKTIDALLARLAKVPSKADEYDTDSDARMSYRRASDGKEQVIVSRPPTSLWGPGSTRVFIPVDQQVEADTKLALIRLADTSKERDALKSEVEKLETRNANQAVSINKLCQESRDLRSELDANKLQLQTLEFSVQDLRTSNQVLSYSLRRSIHEGADNAREVYSALPEDVSEEIQNYRLEDASGLSRAKKIAEYISSLRVRLASLESTNKGHRETAKILSDMLRQLNAEGIERSKLILGALPSDVAAAIRTHAPNDASGICRARKIAEYIRLTLKIGGQLAEAAGNLTSRRGGIGFMTTKSPEELQTFSALWNDLEAAVKAKDIDPVVELFPDPRAPGCCAGGSSS